MPVRYDLSIINGQPQNPLFSEASVQKLIEEFETRDDDVFVCTYVKSGTTWTQQIINLILNEGNEPPKAYSEAVPWLEAAVAGGVLQEREATNWDMEKIAKNPNQRFFKTHAFKSDLPRGKVERVKVIYVARNPKDVVVSLFHHAKNKPDFNFSGEFSDMLGFFVEGTCENGSWFKHVLEWWKESKKDPQHVMFLKYEDLLEDTAEGVRSIASFIGAKVTPEIVQRVVERSSIKSMQQNNKNAAMNHLNHLRKGGAGGWRDYFTVRQSNGFDQLYREKMGGSGLSFDFGEGEIF